MLEKALVGNKTYWGWLGFLSIFMAIAAGIFVWQLNSGLGATTGLTRDVPWAFYIAQLTFLVGVAASAVMVVLPYYLHDFKAFGKLTVLGEFVAISSVIMCLMFVVVDMGQPRRLMNVLLHPTPNSMLFWDATVLNAYMLLNIFITRISLSSMIKGVAPPKWLKPFIYFSIPLAVSIHTVTAFLYCGLAGRGFWLTAILAPRFLASAFAAGPALLILLMFILRKFAKFDAGDKAINKLGEIITYAMCVNVFFILLELFTVFYSDMPEHVHHFEYLFVGSHGHNFIAPFMWVSIALSIFALITLLIPKLRRNYKILPFTCIAVFVALWIDKGMGLVITGFVPNQFGQYNEYIPAFPELMLSLGIYALGLFVLTILYKIAMGYKEKLDTH